MTPPVLPFGSLGPLAGSSTAGMNHTGRQRTSVTQRLPNEEDASTPGWGQPIECHLQPIGSQLAELAASQGIKATWSFRGPDDAALQATQVWWVDRGCGRVEIVKLTGPIVKGGRVLNLWGAVDTTLNKA